MGTPTFSDGIAKPTTSRWHKGRHIFNSVTRSPQSSPIKISSHRPSCDSPSAQIPCPAGIVGIATAQGAFSARGLFLGGSASATRRRSLSDKSPPKIRRHPFALFVMGLDELRTETAPQSFPKIENAADIRRTSIKRQIQKGRVSVETTKKQRRPCLLNNRAAV
ncbi:uncharacterized protein VTP21DRAFT_56 [Calcarisporiella thermophila]|uniref:uncharacterized protein n=1 Tax=Calcarisporiella thermophila TaxID=911321 RepID=UPI00374304CC